MSQIEPVYALLSVSDKTGLSELATCLVRHNIKLLSTGGTANYLREHNIPVIEVADYTGFPEIMGGRVKTLHPKIHAGILYRAGIDEEVLQSNSISAINFVDLMKRVMGEKEFKGDLAWTLNSLSHIIWKKHRGRVTGDGHY